jgi:hypothetical protein
MVYELTASSSKKNGDCLAIGRLEFALIVDAPMPRSGFDPLGDSVCELLLDADRREAEERPADSRWYKIEPIDPYAGMSEKEKLQAKARQKIPQQKRPQKLPQRVTESTGVAVRQALANTQTASSDATAARTCHQQRLRL